MGGRAEQLSEISDTEVSCDVVSDDEDSKLEANDGPMLLCCAETPERDDVVSDVDVMVSS
jgi:hypothetical protein